MKSLTDIGVIGLAVMGENLILNMARHGFSVSCYNRTVAKVDAFIEGRAAGESISGFHSLEDFIQSLKRPRRVMLMIKAGQAVESTIDQLLPLLEPGDIIIDGGNSYYKDTERRLARVKRDGVLYVGAGVSGGEEGALNGPSLMPGGSEEAWSSLKEIFFSIAAKTEAGEPCCDWVGPGGSGHFVKMVHNGIEYGDMQIIAETYALLKHRLRYSNRQMHDVFLRWNRGRLSSYLVQITADILNCQDEGGGYVLDSILDVAGQKGTGKWSIQEALEQVQPLTLISNAVFSRYISALKMQREKASKRLRGPAAQDVPVDEERYLQQLEQALYAAKIISYAQGFQLMKSASEQYGWSLNLGSIALMWRGGCVIRSVFLDYIKSAYDQDAALDNLLLSSFFATALEKDQDGWRQVLSDALLAGIAIPTLASALTYYDAYRTSDSPANLIQAQRDYFGAHLYERTDKPRGEFFHTNWTGTGGSTVSGAYSA